MERYSTGQQPRITENNPGWDEIYFPTPAPLPEAVEAGVFGVCLDGNLLPSPEEVAGMTEEHSCELISALFDIHYLKQCVRLRIDPTKLKPLPDNEKRAQVVKDMENEIASLTDHYEASLDAYVSAFGFDAAHTLDEAIHQLVVRSELQLPDRSVQKSLF